MKHFNNSIKEKIDMEMFCLVLYLKNLDKPTITLFYFTDDYNRVVLTPLDAVVGSDYINASVIKVSSH